MDEAPVADVHAHVVNPTLTYAKKHQIAWKNLRDRHGTGRVLLLSRGARDVNADPLMREKRKPTAVEPAFIGSAEVIRAADERGRGAGDRGPLLNLLRWW